MKATRWHGDRDVRVDDVDEPTILEDTDALVRVTLAGICGTDLHLFNAGSALGLPEGMRIGHEFVGVVEAVGRAVTRVRVGDRVVSPFAFCDDTCFFCGHDMHCNCTRGGIFGFAPLWRPEHGPEIQGCQSEIVRVPLADGTLVPLPESLASGAHDARVLPLADVFSTGWHGAVGADVGPGDTVVVIGDGAVGISAVQAAVVRGAAGVVQVGHHDDRLAIGAKAGATHMVNTATDGAGLGDLVRSLTDGRGADGVIDTIATDTTLAAALDLVRSGGDVSFVGLGFAFHPPNGDVYQTAFWRNVSLHGGVAPSRAYIEELMPLVERGRITPEMVFTHTLPLAQAAQGYAIMDDRAAGSVKVALTAS
ncbi:MAG TPA: alcohol dehydrogenase catalytic domain-containing protein [Miltoncostaeaceae bacterium]|nr:alcohol dehydrogenase catalytic domain-containing protein [Miltoncostaeaceae bacterium]